MVLAAALAFSAGTGVPSTEVAGVTERGVRGGDDVDSLEGL